MRAVRYSSFCFLRQSSVRNLSPSIPPAVVARLLRAQSAEDGTRQFRPANSGRRLAMPLRQHTHALIRKTSKTIHRLRPWRLILVGREPVRRLLRLCSRSYALC
uniref:Secreted protein n=1 Tax=Plectus sambesii TaxID=2011161 RepID=A0A914W2S1_9BILA